MTSVNDHFSPFQHARSLVHDFACEVPSQPGTWSITEDQPTGMLLATIRDAPFRLVRFDSVGSGFSLGTLGANYQRICRENTVGRRPLLAGVLERESTKAKCFLLCFHCRDDSRQPIPLATLLEDTHGDYHLIDIAPNRDPRFWAILTIAMHIMVEQPTDPSRFDTHGDYLTLGAPSIVQRHGTERLRRSVAKRVRYDRRLCLDCLQCVTQCNEMRSLVTSEGATLLGPSEDFCTNCGMCQRRCTYLVAEPRQAASGEELASLPITDGGAGFHLHDGPAQEYLQFIADTTDHKPPWWPYSVTNEWLLPSENSDFPVRRQFRLSAGWGSKPMQITTNRDRSSEDSVLIRSHYRALVLLQSEAGAIEEDLISRALQLGLDVTCAAEPRSSEAVPKPNQATQLCGRLGRKVIIGHSALSLWQNREADLILAPFADRLTPELHQLVLGETGRLSQILSPNILQALPVTRSPVLGQLTRQLADIFTRYPELKEAEADLAHHLLSNIPANHARIHGRYGPLAFSSGHSACPSCVEAQVLAIPVYMGIAMSLAREEIPQVYFTCETGCMSETLNKVNEVAQRVPGGRTVFGGGFAFGEASAMAQDRAVRCGLLPKGRRYVVSQGGDGGAAIGLPAWLNALRQQAYLIRRRHPNVLHFITITDTQVYSNTGGESSVSSMLGMDTLTTPIGKILSGNQRIQWNLINLAAEFPNILVAAGHSANRVAMQQFWQLADQLGQSAMRWDVTPCPETGKFFGDDPDDLAEIMAHAGMIPEILFCGRFRKRIAPYHPEDRGRPYNEWNRRPKPITYWLHRDPRYRTLFRKNAETGSLEPVNLTAHFLITQLESYRDQLNWQIDLETHFVNQAEQWVSSFLQELAQSWKQYRYRLEQFRYAMLFNSKGELKPEVATILEREMVLRVLGWDELTRYTARRERFLHAQPAQFDNLMAELRRLEELTAGHSTSVGDYPGDDRRLIEITGTIQSLNQSMQRELRSLSEHLQFREVADPLEQELFPLDTLEPPTLSEERRKDLYRLLDRILEERALARFTELQQHRLARQLHRDFLDGGWIIKEAGAVAADPARNELLRQIAGIGPFSIGVASLAGDRGIAVNRIFANFFTSKGAWAGMAWQFGSSKRGTPVLSATFVDARPIQRKDAMQSLPMAVLTVTNYEEMKRQPDMFFGQLMPTGFLIINHRRDPEELWQELVRFYPQEVRDLAVALRTKYRAGIAASRQSRQEAAAPGTADQEACPPIEQNERLRACEKSPPESHCVIPAEAGIQVFQSPLDPGLRRGDGPIGHPLGLVPNLVEEISEGLYGKPPALLTRNERQMIEKVAAMVTARLVAIDMDGIIHQATGSTKILSNLVAVAPVHYALHQLGLPFDWDQDLPFLLKGFPGAVLKNPQLVDAYCRAMAIATDRIRQADEPMASRQGPPPGEAGEMAPPAPGPSAYADNPDKYLMIMGGTLAGMVLSQIATAESPLFYVGFPITPAGNPFYAMAEAYANGHPYIVVDENNPSEKVAAEKLLGIARTGGFLPVTFTASQGWRLFTEIIPQFVGARLEGLFLLARRALAAPNLNIEESHTDFMSFRDDGGIMLAPKGIQEYVPALYLARLLTHFARLPVILSIGGITDTHKITLVKAPADDRVRSWLEKTLKDFDFWEHKLINRQGELIVHGPSGTSAVYQETQSELEKAHMAVRRVLPYALQAVEELTGTRLEELEVRSRTPKDRVKTLLILQGSLFPNAVEALEELESQGWTGMACVSVRFFNPFPERALSEWLEGAERVIVMDRSNSFGSIPPLASRVLGTMARLQETRRAARKNPIRILVGGLGGREITVAEMKEVLFSTHLLFHPCEDWEKPLIEELLGKDAHLHALLEEAAACDLRNTDRHTRVPPGLRTDDLRRGEFQDCLDTLKGLLANKQYVPFLANHCQVEFLGVREVLQESALLLEIVKRLEIQLARRAVKENRFSCRRLLILLLYGRGDEDRKEALDLLAGFADDDLISPELKASFGIAVDQPATHGAEANQVDVGPDEGPVLDISPAPPVQDLELAFSGTEAEIIEEVLTDLVTLSGEKALFFNPEDFENELVRNLHAKPESIFYELTPSTPAEQSRDFIREYLTCYRDVIDRTLQREILSQHHAPELRELFEGMGRELLEELAGEVRKVCAEQHSDFQTTVAEEIERYLIRRRIPHYPLPQAFYLEYFRSWILPEIMSSP